MDRPLLSSQVNVLSMQVSHPSMHQHHKSMLGWQEELQVGQQLPPGTAAEENEAKTRRRDKRRKAGEIGEGTKQFRVAAGEEQLWEVPKDTVQHLDHCAI
eukprot:1160995-Pelagomonas_calceolata.AAC.4